MYIHTLALKNFKCFTNIEMEFHPRLTVIAGVNGCGKTSIMEGIAIALSAMFVKMDGLSGRSIDKSQVHLKAFPIGSTQDVQPQYPAAVRATAMTRDGSIAWERCLNRPNGNMTVRNAEEIINLGVELQSSVRNGDADVILPMVAYYGTGRLWDYHREKQSDVFETNNRINGYVDCVDGTANIKLMMNWFTKMTVQKYQNRELGLGDIPELTAVYTAMETCYRRITGMQDVKVRYNIGTRELEVIYRNSDDTLMRIPINQLSDGYKSTISLVADIAYRMAVLNPQLLDHVCEKTEGIVLIDEVDLHLHPTWQHRILDDLTAIFPKVQFIVSTHAPAVISTVRSENIILLDQNDIYEPTGEVHGKDVNTIISSVMNASERPISIKHKFSEFYTAIDNGNADGAERILNELKHEIGSDDTEIVRCNIKLKLLKAGL
nr:MAG TPA: putative ATP-binding protein [Caudoviricetes sp.]